MYSFTQEVISKGLSYEQFEDYTEQIIDKKIVIEPYDKEAYYSYTVANFKRSKRILENIQVNKKLYNELSDGVDKWTWILFDEPWCGDASFTGPVLKAIELASGGDINLKIFLRDEHPEIMEHYLTNNGKSIPKLVCLNKDLKELGTWGPRPAELQVLVQEWMSEGLDADEKIKRVHTWYIKDKSNSVQSEFVDVVKNWKKKDV